MISNMLTKCLGCASLTLFDVATDPFVRLSSPHFHWRSISYTNRSAVLENAQKTKYSVYHGWLTLFVVTQIYCPILAQHCAPLHLQSRLLTPSETHADD